MEPQTEIINLTRREWRIIRWAMGQALNELGTCGCCVWRIVNKEADANDTNETNELDCAAEVEALRDRLPFPGKAPFAYEGGEPDYV